MTEFLPLLFSEEVAVFLPWQRGAHELAVCLEERPDGWHGAFGYIAPSRKAKPGGLHDVFRGPYCSREAAIRNVVAFGVHHLIGMGLDVVQATRLYRAAGVPVPSRWPQPAYRAAPTPRIEDDHDEEGDAA